jgi:hypothetical protein
LVDDTFEFELAEGFAATKLPRRSSH